MIFLFIFQPTLERDCCPYFRSQRYYCCHVSSSTQTYGSSPGSPGDEDDDMVGDGDEDDDLVGEDVDVGGDGDGEGDGNKFCPYLPASLPSSSGQELPQVFCLDHLGIGQYTNH